MPKTKEERAAYAKAYRERKKEEIKAQRAAAYKKAVGGEVRPYVKDLTDEEKKAKQAGYNKAHYEAHKEELKERMKIASKERMKEETPEQRAARLERMRVYNAATTAKRRAKKAEEKAKPAEAPVAKKALPPLTKKNVKGAVLKVDRAKKEAEEAEAKARRDEADAEAQKVEAATRARIIAKVKEQDEAIPEYTGTMEGLVPPEPAQPDMGLVAAKAEAPAKPKGKRELAKEAKRQEAIQELEQHVRDRESGKIKVTEGAMRYYDKRRRELGLPKSFYGEVVEKRKAELASPSYNPSGKSAGQVEVEHNLNRARAMFSVGGGGSMLPLITGFQ